MRVLTRRALVRSENAACHFDTTFSFVTTAWNAVCVPVARLSDFCRELGQSFVYACRSAVLVSDIDSDSSKVEEDREASASMQTVLSSTRCAWGFELDLECGHRRFYFTHDDSPPPLAGCYECSYPRSEPASLSSHPSSSRRRAVDTSTFLEASDDDRVARRGTE